MVEETIKQLIEEYVRLLRSEGIDVVKAILYGSRVRGDVGEDNDIDVALIINGLKRDNFNIKRTLMRLAVRVDERIEPVAFSPEDYEADDWLPLLYSIKDTGLEIDVE